MDIGQLVAFAFLIYAAPPVLLAVTLLFLSVLVWTDMRLLGRKLTLSGDIGRRWDLQRETVRFRRLRSPSVFYMLWTFGNSGVQAIGLYRVSSTLAAHGMRLPADLVRRVAIVLTGVDLSPYAHIGRGFVIHHGWGVVIGKGTVIGENVTVYHDVTTGSGAPHLEDEVIVWPGARIIGNVTIGRGSEVGANAVVLADVPPKSIAVGVPANRIIPKEHVEPSTIQAGGEES